MMNTGNKVVEVLRCEDCWFCYTDSEYQGMSCNAGGEPDNRAKRPNTGEIVEKVPQIVHYCKDQS